MKCDFRKPSSKDFFKAKLSGEPLHFGFIPVWQRKVFAKFCIEHNLIEKIPGNHPTSYKVNHVFAYKRTWHRKGWPYFPHILIELYADLFDLHTKYIGRETVVVEHRDKDSNYTGYNYVQVRDGWLHGGWEVR